MKRLMIIFTMLAIAITAPCLAQDKPYEPKTKAEWLTWSQMKADEAVLRASEKWEKYSNSLERWNAVVKKGKAAEAKKAAEKKKAEEEAKEKANNGPETGKQDFKDTQSGR